MQGYKITWNTEKCGAGSKHKLTGESADHSLKEVKFQNRHSSVIYLSTPFIDSLTIIWSVMTMDEEDRIVSRGNIAQVKYHLWFFYDFCLFVSCFG